MPEKMTYDELERRVRQLEKDLSVLQIKKQRCEQILSSLDTGLSLINPDNTVAWVNNKIKEMFPQGDPVGQICHKFYESADEPCTPCPAIQCFESGKVHETERYNPVSGMRGAEAGVLRVPGHHRAQADGRSAQGERGETPYGS